ncbi:hypothetical protein [Desulfosarcina ovata]|uniref:Uncharacterized protein n=1 Tax=Desulfosarcina ovata subsp. ovata TaxID=2752305 RepID=A0A5K8A8E8_9BACT|nr:hypothetical protein [Desulfosarcina ovata]BBO88739.1 hypothetical protein DSCOOX_19190 [Desulfosarcina ovata subsp. ovata]
MSSVINAGPLPKIFTGKTHCGLFTAVKKVERAKESKETGIPGIYTLAYSITFDANAVLPELNNRRFTVVGQRGEGIEAGALGLEDWLPTVAGEIRVLAFDADNFTHAKYATYLGGGNEARLVWRDCELFSATARPAMGLDPAKVAQTLASSPPPLVTFFRLTADYDRSVWQNEEALRAFAGYLENSAVTQLDRRNVLAHYFALPASASKDALRNLSTGMVNLAVDLMRADQIPSSGVMLERMRAFFETAPGIYAFKPPELSNQVRDALIQLLASEDSGATEGTRKSLKGWLLGH